MIIYRNFDKIQGKYTACIGFFDGVHRGHQFLLEHLKEEARRAGTLSAVVTFEDHPRRVVQPDCDLLLIDTLDERMHKLELMGVDACFLIAFDERVRQLTAQQFICDVMSRQMHITRLLIGFNHRFGRNRAEGFADYVLYGRQCGMTVVQEPVYDDGTGLIYSSSEVRRALQEGNILKAQQLLGWDGERRMGG